jgi:hypothetical protein
LVAQSNSTVGGKSSAATYKSSSIPGNWTKTSLLLTQGDGQGTPSLGHMAQWGVFYDPRTAKYYPTFSTPGTTSSAGDPPVVGRFVFRNTTAFNPRWQTSTVGYNYQTCVSASTIQKDSVAGTSVAKEKGGFLSLSTELDVRARNINRVSRLGVGVSLRTKSIATIPANGFAIRYRQKFGPVNPNVGLYFSLSIGTPDSIHQLGTNGYVSSLRGGYTSYNTTATGVPTFFYTPDTDAGSTTLFATSTTRAPGIRIIDPNLRLGWHTNELSYSTTGHLRYYTADTLTKVTTVPDVAYLASAKGILLNQEYNAGATHVDGTSCYLDRLSVRQFVFPDPVTSVTGKHAHSDTMVVNTADTYIDEYVPTYSAGRVTSIYWGASASGSNVRRNALVWPNLPAGIIGSTVISAIDSFWVRSGGSANDVADVYPIEEEWCEGTATTAAENEDGASWNFRGHGTSILGNDIEGVWTTPGGVSATAVLIDSCRAVYGYWMVVDVTSYVREVAAGTRTNYGYAFRSRTPITGRQAGAAAREWTTDKNQRHRLTVVYRH